MKKILCILLCLCLLGGLVPVAFADYNQMDETALKLRVGNKTREVKAYNASYAFNTFISLRALAEVLKGTAKQFDFDYCSTQADGEYFAITSGSEYIPVEDETEKAEEGEKLFLAPARNRLFVDGSEKKYYTYRYGQPDDLYMHITDILLLFDMGAEYTAADVIQLYPDKTFAADLKGLQGDGFFENVNSVLVGDANSRKVLFATDENVVYPVASITKLMTYLLTVEAIEGGKIGRNDEVRITAGAAAVAKSEDGMLEIEEGQLVPLEELMKAMLVASSNEAALAIAEHVSGSEAAFVELMNSRASELGLTSVRFYNCNGLPYIKIGTVQGKLQNSMSSADLFRLTCTVLSECPEITEITSQQFVHLETLDYTTANSNPLVFNLGGVTGLKTGNTKAAGQCLVACSDAGKVVIVLGAEDAAIRGRIAEILFRCS